MGAMKSIRESVFSAHAEVVPVAPGNQGFDCGILRARGGSSHFFHPSMVVTAYSPRTRR